MDDFGARRIQPHGLLTDEVARETYRIHREDPLSARAEIHWSERLQRDDWQVRTETKTQMWADRTHFFVHATLEAYEADARVFERTWDRQIARKLV